MLHIRLKDNGPLRILCLGAHCDDIEIGCGGTIVKLATARPDMEVRWVVFSSDEQRKSEATQSASRLLENVGSREVIIHDFQDGFLPYFGRDVKHRFEELKNRFSPDVVLTHYRHDLHQDHRFVSELTWSTFRDHLILEYEVPKYDGDLGSPNFFVALDESLVERKIDTILNTFKSQDSKHWFSRDLFLSILRIRGMEANAADGYAEAFYCRKAVIALEGK